MSGEFSTEINLLLCRLPHSPLCSAKFRSHPQPPIIAETDPIILSSQP